MNVTGANVLITGATGGIGQAITRAFAARRANLVLTGRRADVLEPLAQELGARPIVCDLSKRKQVEQLAGDSLEAGIEVFVSNAANPASGVLTDLTAEQVDRMLRVNLRSPIMLAQALAPSMIERRRGHMVFISSLAGKAASPSSSIYSATKFGLRGFALALREDLRPYGVGVSTISPGFIHEAGMFADAGVELPKGVGTKSPQDVAAAVIRAIERNRAEIDVAPVPMRVGAALAGLAPQLSSAVSRRLGSEELAANLTAGQLEKR
jgi:short-subunit dehydrogenase